ncbi:hypothetical protein OG979_12505 [Actinomadura citrea]|uniref:hypothetical protein n=1 Tax=Actinomadura citrea TaxID=46158 RepID=UPI002E2C9164|nr:hypothetical protein [Actinomadura citrea]
MGAKRSTVAAGVLAIIAATAGCSSGGSGRTPSGYVRGDAKVLTVAYPKDWRRGPDGDAALSVQAPRQTATLSVITELGERGRPEMLEATIEAASMMNAGNYHRTGSKPIKVAGAKDALRVDFTFSGFRGTGAPGQAADVGVIGGDGTMHVVRLIWRRGGLKDDVVDDVIDSIRVR